MLKASMNYTEVIIIIENNSKQSDILKLHNFYVWKDMRFFDLLNLMTAADFSIFLHMK